MKEIDYNDIEEFKFLKNNILNEKNNTVSHLIKILTNTVCPKIRDEIAFLLVDNFKDNSIIPTLKILIKRKDLLNYNANLVYAFGEYSTNEDHLDFLVDIVLDCEYHPALNAFNIITDMKLPLSENNIKLQLQKINSKTIQGEKEGLVKDLIQFFNDISEK